MNRKERAKIRKRKRRLLSNKHLHLSERKPPFPPNINTIKDQFLTLPEKQKLSNISASKMAVRKLKQRRKKLKLKQKYLALKTGIPQGTISRIENGKQNATLDTLQKIAQSMGCMIELEVISLPAFHEFDE